LASKKALWKTIAVIIVVIIVAVSAYYLIHLKVSGYMGGAPSKPVTLGVSSSNNSTVTQFLITSGNISVSPSSPLIITITPPSGAPVSATLTMVADPQTQPSGYTVHVYSITGHQYLAAGDKITISTSSGAPLQPGTTVTFTYNAEVIYEYMGGAPSKPVALGVSPSITSTATQFLITSGNISVNPGTPLIITLSFTNGTVGSANIWVLGKSDGYSFNTTSPSNASFGNIINIYTVSGAHYLAAGDTISISISNAPLPPGTTVTFTYNGNVIYKYTV
jgi:hypothetical protein